MPPPPIEPPDIEGLTALAATFGIEILGPPGAGEACGDEPRLSTPSRTKALIIRRSPTRRDALTTVSSTRSHAEGYIA
jgi:hypothetical protein